MLAGDWLVSLKYILQKEKKNPLHFFKLLGLLDFQCLLGLKPGFAPAPDTFFQGLVGGKRTSTRSGGKEKKMQTNKKKEKKKKENKKGKKTWGLVSYPLTPPPPKTQSDAKLPGFGCFWIFCGLPVFFFSETDPSEVLGGLRERLLPSSPGRLAPAERLPGPRERSPALPWRRGPGGSWAAGRLAQCAWVGAGADWEL